MDISYGQINCIFYNTGHDSMIISTSIIQAYMSFYPTCWIKPGINTWIYIMKNVFFFIWKIGFFARSDLRGFIKLSEYSEWQIIMKKWL